MIKKLIECVPNFSEGRDMNVIKQITDEIEKTEGVKLLDVDPGAATNRTVVTFVGTPDEVIEAAYQAVKKAAEVIDMRHHKGEHPRFGATDVCPLVPVANITMEETVEYARKLAKRIGEELGIPVYCYENAAFTEVRRNLANCRAGEYEALPERIVTEEWKPDFGTNEFTEQVARTGVTAVGARDFLVAFNVNLNTTSTRRANAIAFDVRERGRVKREGDPITGKIVKDENGNPVMIPGTLKAVKAIGWFIEEYGVAQISMNLTNISITPVHIAFDEVCKKADARGIRVTGSELVGLIPLKAMLDAGKYFLRKQKRSVGVDNDELIKIASKSMGLDDLKPFNPKEKIIEYILEGDEKKLVDMTVKDLPMKRHPNHRHRVAVQLQLRWVHWAFRWGPWWPTCHPTNAAGTTAGKSSPNGPKKASILRMNYCIWWMKTPMLSTRLWMRSDCRKRQKKKKKPGNKPLRKPQNMPWKYRLR